MLTKHQRCTCMRFDKLCLLCSDLCPGTRVPILWRGDHFRRLHGGCGAHDVHKEADSSPRWLHRARGSLERHSCKFDPLGVRILRSRDHTFHPRHSDPAWQSRSHTRLWNHSWLSRFQPAHNTCSLHTLTPFRAPSEGDKGQSVCYHSLVFAVGICLGLHMPSPHVPRCVSTSAATFVLLASLGAHSWQSW